jgi:PE family
VSSYVIAVPEAIAGASSDLSEIAEALRTATGRAVPSTTGIVVAGRDEVSAAIARVFGTYGDRFQALSAQSMAFHDRFVQAFGAGAAAYERTEAVSTSPLQTAAVLALLR